MRTQGLQRLSALLLAFSGATSVFGAQVQKSGLVLPPDAPKYLNKVRDMFTETYSAYTEHAWGHDDLAPLSKGFVDGRNKWGATIIDSLSTMHVMGLEDLFEKGVEFAVGVDFSQGHTNDTVSIFETTIRYLGGLLSAYELSDGKYPELLVKAQQVADKMIPAWQGTSPIPYSHIQPRSNEVVQGTSNIAEAGTLSLEWCLLSQYTKNATYCDLALGSARHIATQPAPLPGLAVQGINPATGLAVGKYVTWGGGSDSYFEYLIKYARLTNTDDNLWADTWATAVSSSLTNLLKKSTVGDWTYLADWNNGKIVHTSSNLACFHAGNWLLGGRMLNNQTIVDTALLLNEACWNTYASTSTGIGPELFGFISDDGDYTGGGSPTPEELAYYNLHGNYPYGDYTYYYLRPEVLESNFMAWRVTGDVKYVERAARTVDNFQKYLKAPAGYAGIENVNNPSAGQIDDTESFWYAEVLKYLYLTFDVPEKISVDNYIFNTECQLFKAPPAKEFYGSGTGATPTGKFVAQDSSDPLAPTVSQAVRIPVQLTEFIEQFY